MTEPVGRLRSVALDCDDPRALAGFWAAALGGEHRLAKVKLTVPGKNFADAARMALDHLSAILSRIAFRADTAIEISAVVSEEKTAQIVHAEVTAIGSVQPARTALTA